jgi:hypothetical protein
MASRQAGWSISAVVMTAFGPRTSIPRSRAAWAIAAIVLA